MTIVTKRFRSCRHGEPEREWRALELLATYAPGLAPAPVHADLDADPPAVVMSRVPGTPYTDDPRRRTGLIHAIDRLHRALPAAVLARLPAAIPPAKLATRVARYRDTLAIVPDPFVRKAFDAGVAWFGGRSARAALAPDVPQVFGQGDGNPANFLWDGTRIRLIDFEASGSSDRAYELAGIVEHIESGALDVEAFLAGFELPRAERLRVLELRRLFALSWLFMLLPGGPAHARNPPETLPRQAERLLFLLDP